jgi:virginiamycin B lyase
VRRGATSLGASIALLLGAAAAWAGGSNYGLTPGVRAQLTGTISEWPVPTPRFARDPAPGPDGNIYIAVMSGNRIARFDPRAQVFKEWDLPRGARPHGLLVDPLGMVWYTGNGNGTIGRLDPGTGAVTEYRAPSGGDPHTLVLDERGVIWFTVNGADRIGRLDTRSGAVTEYQTSGQPYGIALDRQGQVWFCQIRASKLGRLDPRTGQISELALPAGSMPRRMSAAPDGSLWVTLYGKGALLRLDPATSRVVKEYPLPAGSRGGPYAVNVDGGGFVWVNEINTDTVVRLDPATGAMRVFSLPSRGVGIRKMTVDVQGRLWYMGSHNGRLGVIE